ncbi:MAG: RNA polymerase sigma factor [Gemmatimonadales bacterium]|nr:RNA polymerase sigma factor [Gemmatimonadales bacterium]
MTVLTDDDLIREFLAGNEAAATELVARLSPPLARYLATVGADPGEVEDLVQESLFRAFRSAQGWKGHGSFRAWVFRIGVNLARDRARANRRLTLVPIEDEELAAAADPEGEMRARELAGRIEGMLAELPRLQREVFLLRAQQALGYDEIALALSTTPGAARVHYHHAVRRLKGAVT